MVTICRRNGSTSKVDFANTTCEEKKISKYGKFGRPDKDERWRSEQILDPRPRMILQGELTRDNSSWKIVKSGTSFVFRQLGLSFDPDQRTITISQAKDASTIKIVAGRSKIL